MKVFIPARRIKQVRQITKSSDVVVLILLREPETMQSDSLEFERPSMRNLDTWARPIGRHSRLSYRYQTILTQPQKIDILAGILDPVIFIYPLAMLVASELANRIDSNASGIRGFSDKAFGGDDDFVSYSFEFEATLYVYAFEMLRAAARSTLDEIKYTSFRPGSTRLETPELMSMTVEYERLVERCNGCLQKIHTIETRSINHRSVKQMQKANQQSDSVKRLSILAFIFLPFSLTSSFFGMHTIELNPVSMSVVVATMIGALVAICLLWAISVPVAGALSAFQRNLDGLRFNARMLWTFSSISPMGTFWLLVYGLSHDPELFSPLMRELGIRGVLRLGEEWEQPDIGTSRQSVPLSRFWQKRAESIAEITGFRGWQRETMRQRHIRKKKENKKR